jgi:hypothetical protein
MGKIFIKLIILIFLVATGQSCIIAYKIHSFLPLMRLEKSLKEKVEIVYFGDSVNADLAKTDTDKRILAQWLADQVPEHSLVSIDHAAYQAEIYLAFCRYIIKQKNHPKLVIIPINLRSFSASWDKNYGWQFEDEKAILNSKVSFAFYKTIEVFNKNDKRYNEISQEEFYNTEVFNGQILAGKVRDFEADSFRHYSEENMKKSVVYFYMYSLKKDQRFLNDLISAAKLLQENGFKTIFYITPVDYQTGEIYFPKEFSARIKENTDVIKAVFKENNVELFDFSFDLDKNHFAWEKYINEHLNQKGKAYLSKKLSQEVKEILGD